MIAFFERRVGSGLVGAVGEPARGSEVLGDPHGLAECRGGIGNCCHIQSELLNGADWTKSRE